MPPAILLAGMLSTAYGALFHLWRGGPLRRLALFVAAAWIGFAAGQVAGNLLAWDGAMLGEVHLVEATLGSLIALLIVNRPSA
jgi:hypothetical protein